MKKILFSIILFFSLFSVANASVCFPASGCTGTSTVPSLGQIVAGLNNGTYGPIATGTAGQVLSSSSTAPFGLLWITPSGSSIWGNITGTLSNQTDLQNALNLLVPFSYASSTYASTSWIVGSFPTYSYASSTYYFASNPAFYITSTTNALINYPSYSYASSTYASTSWVTKSFPTYSYASSSFPSFTYASSTYYFASNPSGYISMESDPVWTAASTSYLSTTSASILYVPYTGATGNVNLGTHGLTVTNATTTGLVFTGITSAFLAVDQNGNVISTTTPTGGGTPGGLTSSIQYNNSGVFGGSSTTIQQTGSITLPDRQVLFTGVSPLAFGDNTYGSFFVGGAGSTTATSNGDGSTALGGKALSSVVSVPVFFNTAVGNQALAKLISGSYNDAFGYGALINATSSAHNSAFGVGALGNIISGSSNLGIGQNAGYYATSTSNDFFVNQGIDHGSYVGDQVGSLLYGQFNTATTSQFLEINASTTISSLQNAGFVKSLSSGALYNDTNTYAIASVTPSYSYASSTFASTSYITATYVPYSGATKGVNLNSQTLSNVLTYNGLNLGLGASGIVSNVVVGSTYNLGNITTGTNNVGIGQLALADATSSTKDTAVGYESLQGAEGNDNVGFGSLILGATTNTGNDNTAIGDGSLFNGTSNSNDVGIGFDAGRYATSTSNELFINNQDRTNYTGDKQSSLLYGQFNSATTSQFLTINGALNIIGTSTLATTSISSLSLGNGLLSKFLAVDQNGNVIATTSPSFTTGTVTSVGLVMPTGFTVSNSPVTTSGNLTAAVTAGYIGAFTLSTTTSGTDVSIATTTSSLVFNFPSASASNRGLLTSADWTTFNGKQNTITNPVTGTGTNGFDPYWTSTSAISTGKLIDNGTVLGVNASSSSYTFNLQANSATSPLLIASSSPTNVFLTVASNGSIDIGTSTNWSVLNNDINPLYIVGTSTAAFETVMQNLSNTPTSSADYTLESNNGNDSKYYADFGINNSYNNDQSFSIATTGDAYLYSSDYSLAIGTASSSATAGIKFFTGGTLSGNQRMAITSTGNVGIGTSTPAAQFEVYGSSTNAIANFASSSKVSALNISVKGFVGIASTTPVQALSVGSGSILVPEVILATSTSMTIDWSIATSSNQYLVRIGGSATTITMSNCTPGQKAVVNVQNGTGTAGALTWSGVIWAKQTVPTQTTTANNLDVWSFMCTAASSTPRILGTGVQSF